MKETCLAETCRVWDEKEGRWAQVLELDTRVIGFYRNTVASVTALDRQGTIKTVEAKELRISSGPICDAEYDVLGIMENHDR